MLLRKIRRDLGQRKFRTSLTVIGLAIAVIGITGVAITNSSVIESTEIAYGLNISSDIHISVRETEWNNSSIGEINGVDDYEYVYRSYSTLSVNQKQHRVSLWGIDISRVSNYHSLYGLILDSGSLPDSSKNEILIDTSAAHAFTLGIGDTVLLPILSSSDSQVNNINFTISGLARAVRDPGYTFSSTISVWLSLDKVQSLLSKPDVFNNIFIKVTDDSNPDDVSKRVMNNLDGKSVFVENVEIIEISQDFRIEILGLMNVLFSLAMIIGIILGGILTTSTIQMAIANEKKDISLLKINGATRRHIFFIYVLEAVVLGFIGAILGTIFSIIFAYYLLSAIADPYGLSKLIFIVPESSVIIGFAIPIIISIIFSIPVIVGAIRVSPLTVFQTQDTLSKKAKKYTTSFVLLNFSFNNFKRKKIRISLISIMLIIAVGSVVGFRVVGDSTVTVLVDILDDLTGDVEISTSTPENETLMRIFLTDYFNEYYPEEIELWTTIWKFKYVNMFPSSDIEPESMTILGIHPENPLWESYSKSGSWLSPETSENQVLLTNLYVNKHPNLNLSIGSQINLGTPLYNETFTIVGYINDVDNGGMRLYTSISTLNRFMGSENLINFVTIELKDHSIESQMVAALSSNEFVLAKSWGVVGMTFWKEKNIEGINFIMLFFDLMGYFTLLVCIIGGVNAFTLSVLEREREIGILKLIGAKPRWIIISLLSEALIIGTIAGIFGILVARFVIANSFLDLFGQIFIPIPISFTLDHIILALTTSLLTIIIASLYPSYRASKTSVISALRYE
ncbi:MAG: ABC transporter permease [Candidatus Hermodarchaeota archaeon]